MSRRNFTIKVLVLCFVVVVLFVWGRVSGLIYGGMFGGRILDEATQQPIKDAYVIALWSSRSFHETHCIYMDIERTGDNGEYFFPLWVDFADHTVFSQESPVVIVYAPSYEQVNHRTPIKLKEHDDTPKKRIKEINRISGLFCGAGHSNVSTEKSRVREKMFAEATKLLEQISDDPEGRYRYRVLFLKRKCGERCQ